MLIKLPKITVHASAIVSIRMCDAQEGHPRRIVVDYFVGTHGLAHVAYAASDEELDCLFNDITAQWESYITGKAKP